MGLSLLKSPIYFVAHIYLTYISARISCPTTSTTYPSA